MPTTHIPTGSKPLTSPAFRKALAQQRNYTGEGLQNDQGLLGQIYWL